MKGLCRGFVRQEFPKNDAEAVDIGFTFILLTFEDFGPSSGCLQPDVILLIFFCVFDPGEAEILQLDILVLVDQDIRAF